MVTLTPLLVLATAVVLVTGTVLTHLGYRAYRRTGAAALRALAAGFALVTTGAVAGTLLGVGGHAVVGLGASSLLIAAGFLVMAYSLYARQPPFQPPSHGQAP